MPAAVPLSTAIDEYLVSRRSRGIAANTLRIDQQVLRRFLAVTGNIQCRHLEGRHVDAYFTAIGYQKESTRNLGLEKLRGFFRWAKGRDYLTQDLTTDRRRVKVPEPTRMLIPVERFPDLLDAADHPRDRIIVALGIYLFLRGGELSYLRVGDVDLDGGWIETYQEKTKTRDRMPICEELDTELREWLTWYAANIDQPLAGDMFLIPVKVDHRSVPGPKGKFVSAGGRVGTTVRPYKSMGRPYQAVQRALAACGYGTLGEGVHTLRRSGARALFEQLRGSDGSDGALQQVKVMLHHKNASMTEHYLGLAPEREQRDARLRGKPMFASKITTQDNVVELRG